MQDYSKLMAHPTGTLESIAVRTAVNTLTPPNVTGALQGMSTAPARPLHAPLTACIGTGWFHGGQRRHERSAHPRGHPSAVAGAHRLDGPVVGWSAFQGLLPELLHPRAEGDQQHALNGCHRSAQRLYGHCRCIHQWV